MGRQKGSGLQNTVFSCLSTSGRLFSNLVPPCGQLEQYENMAKSGQEKAEIILVSRIFLKKNEVHNQSKGGRNGHRSFALACDAKDTSPGPRPA